MFQHCKTRFVNIHPDAVAVLPTIVCQFPFEGDDGGVRGTPYYFIEMKAATWSSGLRNVLTHKVFN